MGSEKAIIWKFSEVLLFDKSLLLLQIDIEMIHKIANAASQFHGSHMIYLSWAELYAKVQSKMTT